MEAFIGESKAQREKFEGMVRIFEAIGAVEAENRKRYRRLLRHIRKGVVFTKSEGTVWICLNCGRSVDGQRPQTCPDCRSRQLYFELPGFNHK